MRIICPACLVPLASNFHGFFPNEDFFLGTSDPLGKTLPKTSDFLHPLFSHTLHVGVFPLLFVVSPFPCEKNLRRWCLPSPQEVWNPPPPLGKLLPFASYNEALFFSFFSPSFVYFAPSLFLFSESLNRGLPLTLPPPLPMEILLHVSYRSYSRCFALLSPSRPPTFPPPLRLCQTGHKIYQPWPSSCEVIAPHRLS